MELIRGTTPTITINVMDSDIDLDEISTIWIYITQNKKVIVDKATESVIIDKSESKIVVSLSQTDTLKLSPGCGFLQLRILLEDELALASKPIKIDVIDILKEGYIT